MKLWGGRFQKETDQRMNAFHSSLFFDQRLAVQDIRGSIAHATMLGKTGILLPEEAKTLINGLESILRDLHKGAIEFAPEAEDIHMNIEKILTERVGPLGKQLHTARSRNDQVALDLRLYLLEQTQLIDQELKKLLTVLVELAKANVENIMPGYTHLQRAQPISLAHHLLAYGEMFRRDRHRLADSAVRMNVSPLGAGALAGTVFPIDREFVAAELGMDGVARNSMDAVGDRDFVLETIFNASLIMMHLSRFCEEIILWTSAEWAFMELDDAFSTGSSMMPQKKNPDAAELIRGKTGRVYGDLIGLLTVMKGLPLAYNKDLQEDKEAVFDAIDTVLSSLHVFIPMLSTAHFFPERMQQATEDGFLNATDLADFLVEQGLPFREAHTVVGKAITYCLEKKIKLEDLSVMEMSTWSGVDCSAFQEAIKIKTCLERRMVKGGPAPTAVLEAINEVENYLQSS
ncbi:MAG TPA: argininosuccinate lyase [Firmicutes bacterium]|nr:argininosuccinate lyase [Bacillota bacterium]